jgi:hypothetical protein
MTDLRFYLGTHRPTWLWKLRDVPLFISHRVLRDRKSPFPKATTRWALDSGGFTELNLYGGWKTTPDEYIASVRRYSEELGSLDWASPQDWMCEPWVLNKTGLTVAEHQRRTTENYLELVTTAPGLGFIPVLQGWELDDYLRHADAYADAGVDLSVQPVVGVGSVCRRQGTHQIAEIFAALSERGLRMHGFGVKSSGLAKYADHLVSADSLAWSYRARRNPLDQPECGKNNCANCMHYALEWRDRILNRLKASQITNTLGVTA